MARPIRVLIVEDSEDDALLVLRQLRMAGFDPALERVDSAEAMAAALDEREWDLVLSDFMMPRFSGLEAVNLLKRKQLDIPIIIVSGKIGEETAVDCMRAGASDYLMKDNLKRLGTAIERELREVEVRRSHTVTEERLRVTDASFRRVIEQNADGILIVTEEGTIQFVNPAAEALFGRKGEEMVGSTFGFPLGEGIELEILKDGGEKATVEMRIVDTDWQGAPALLATLRDITQRKKALLALQQSETRLRLFLEQIPCVSWTMDSNLRFTSFYWSELESHGIEPRQVVGMTLSEGLRTSDMDYLPYSAHVQALRGTPAAYEVHWSGRTFYGRVEALRDSEDRIIGVVGVALDITARKTSEDQLRNLSHRLVTAQEDERRRIARELHDEVGQLLTALKLNLDKAALVSHNGDASDLAEARSSLKELMGRVRSMSLELRPTMLDDLGLLPTLQWHFKRYTMQTGIQVHFDFSGLRRNLPQDAVTVAYRTVQEALTNVARYARVKEVEVSVHVRRDTLTVEVADRGAGFDVEKIGPASMGLRGMRERVLSLKGKLLVESEPGQGTRLVAELPLAKTTRKVGLEKRLP